MVLWQSFDYILHCGAEWTVTINTALRWPHASHCSRRIQKNIQNGKSFGVMSLTSDQLLSIFSVNLLLTWLVYSSARLNAFFIINGLNSTLIPATLSSVNSPPVTFCMDLMELTKWMKQKPYFYNGCLLRPTLIYMSGQDHQICVHTLRNSRLYKLTSSYPRWRT